MFIWMIKMRTANKRNREARLKVGSALILTVVLTSLLAIVGVLFVMVARVDKMATSSISENRELNFAIDTVTSKIAQELAEDVPGAADLNEEYYDYPDPNNSWLAVLEPYEYNGNYYWRQISDITGHTSNWSSNVRAVVIGEDDIIDYNSLVNNVNTDADADGDGVGDSKWTELEDVTSDKGRPIFAAVRVIDNGAMLNVNTAYKFDPNNFAVTQDGPEQMWRINLMALAGRPGDPATLGEEENLLKARANNGLNVNPYDLDAYNKNVIWRYNKPDSLYTPFDISDELELRYRFLLNHTSIDTRLEQWDLEFRSGTLSTPLASGGGSLDTWFKRVNDAGLLDPNYAYRHIATTYNMDRIINPAGRKMVNVNTANINEIYDAISEALLDREPNAATAGQLAAQLAVNLVDLRDMDAYVTALRVGTNTYYGFEAQPFVSEIGFKINNNNANISSYNNFAIELYNPFYVEIPLGDFRLELHWQSGDVSRIENLTGYVISDESRFVITNNRDASDSFGVADSIRFGGCKENFNLELAKYILLDPDQKTYKLDDWCKDIYLIRHTSAQDIYLDKQSLQENWFPLVVDPNTENTHFYSRPENDWNVVYQDMVPSSGTLGKPNEVTGDKKNYNIPFSLLYDKFITVGDVAKVLTIGPNEDPCDTIGDRLASQPDEEFVRLDLENPAFAGIFQYLTVIDPVSDFIDNDGDGLGIDINDNGFLDANEIDEDEIKVPGRINLNTAPWYVIAQLPWMMPQMMPQIAQAIVTHRDTIAGGFKSVSELMQVPEMGYYAHDANDLENYPDLSYRDGAVDDFEERDVIFSRISNLATVRSDVFTAYILVRIGIDGPQRRVIAIFDRSQVSSPADKVRILALYPVPDPR